MLGFKKFIIKALCLMGLGLIIALTAIIFHENDQNLHDALVIVSFMMGIVWAHLNNFIDKAHDEIKKELNKQS